MAVAYLEALPWYTFLIFHFQSRVFSSPQPLKQSTTNNWFSFTTTHIIAYSQKKVSMPKTESEFPNIPVLDTPRKQGCISH